MAEAKEYSKSIFIRKYRHNNQLSKHKEKKLLEDTVRELLTILYHENNFNLTVSFKEKSEIVLDERIVHTERSNTIAQFDVKDHCCQRSAGSCDALA